MPKDKTLIFGSQGQNVLDHTCAFRVKRPYIALYVASLPFFIFLMFSLAFWIFFSRVSLVFWRKKFSRFHPT